MPNISDFPPVEVSRANSSIFNSNIVTLSISRWQAADRIIEKQKHLENQNVDILPFFNILINSFNVEITKEIAIHTKTRYIIFLHQTT